MHTEGELALVPQLPDVEKGTHHMACGLTHATQPTWPTPLQVHTEVELALVPHLPDVEKHAHHAPVG